MANMAFRMLETVAVAVHGLEPPTSQEWQRWVDACCGRPAPEELRVYVVTLGGGPDAAQRKQLDEAMQGAHPRVAVMTNSAFARGVITALSWLGRTRIKGFAPQDVDAALDHLGLSRSLRHELERTVQELQSDLAAASD